MSETNNGKTAALAVIMSGAVGTAPIGTSETVWGRYDVMAVRPSGHNATHPITKQDLGPAFDRLTRVSESRAPGGKRSVHWNIGCGVGRDGCAYSGGYNFKTKRDALKSWNSK